MNKRKLTIVLGMLLILVLILFLGKFNFTGNVVSDLATNQTTTSVTQEQAQVALEESENIMNNMQKQGFSINYINDTIIEAKIVFQQVGYALVLRNSSSTELEKQNARSALTLVKWQNLSYADVLVYTQDIASRQQTAYLLYDTLILQEKKIDSSSETAKAILSQAKLAFAEERYDDTQKLIKDLTLQIEKEQSEKTTLGEMKKATQSFFQTYWLQIIVFTLFLILIIRLIYKRLEKRILAKKIKKMKIEENVLDDMMKRTQEERYKENKISSLVYNIRMKKYQSRIQEIKEELPVLEARLRKEVKNK